MHLQTIIVGTNRLFKCVKFTFMWCLCLKFTFKIHTTELKIVLLLHRKKHHYLHIWGNIYFNSKLNYYSVLCEYYLEVVFYDSFTTALSKD